MDYDLGARLDAIINQLRQMNTNLQELSIQLTREDLADEEEEEREQEEQEEEEERELSKASREASRETPRMTIREKNPKTI